jgi:hypothetical protein
MRLFPKDFRHNVPFRYYEHPESRCRIGEPFYRYLVAGDVIADLRSWLVVVSGRQHENPDRLWVLGVKRRYSRADLMPVRYAPAELRGLLFLRPYMGIPCTDLADCGEQIPIGPMRNGCVLRTITRPDGHIGILIQIIEINAAKTRPVDPVPVDPVPVDPVPEIPVPEMPVLWEVPASEVEFRRWVATLSPSAGTTDGGWVTTGADWGDMRLQWTGARIAAGGGS